MISSLRDFLDILDKNGQLLRIKKEFDPKFEIAAVTRKMQKASSKALLFERPKGNDIPIAISVLGSVRNVELAIGVKYSAFFDQWTRSLHRQISPRKVSDGSCKEKKITKDIDIRRFPLMTHGTLEPAPYISAGIVAARIEEEGTYNLGYSRMMLAGKDTMVCRLVEGTTNRVLLDKASKENRPLPVAVCIGNSPYVAWSGATTLPRSVDHYGFAGSLGNSSVNLVNCGTNDVEVPAETEIVLEGEFLPNEWLDEGPFADFLGYYTPPRKNHVLKIKCITHRTNPIYQGVMAGWSEDQFLQSTLPARVYETVKRVVPNVLDVTLWNLSCVIKIRKTSDEEPRLAILAAWGAQPLQAKFVTIFDEDVDIHNASELNWALTTRSRPDRIVRVPRVIGFGGQGHRGKVHFGRIGIDATLPIEARDSFVRVNYLDENDVDMTRLFDETRS